MHHGQPRPIPQRLDNKLCYLLTLNQRRLTGLLPAPIGTTHVSSTLKRYVTKTTQVACKAPFSCWRWESLRRKKSQPRLRRLLPLFLIPSLAGGTCKKRTKMATMCSQQIFYIYSCIYASKNMYREGPSRPSEGGGGGSPYRTIDNIVVYYGSLASVHHPRGEGRNVLCELPPILAHACHLLACAVHM